MRIVFLNGPPRCGKDTAGSILQESLPDWFPRLDKFARVLKERTHMLYGLVDEETIDYDVDPEPRPHDFYETCKDLPHADFLGRTPREAYIAVSEHLMKPLHGEDIFGQFLLREYKQMSRNGYDFDTLILTDSGFASEAAPIVEWAGTAQCTLIRIHREGCTFAGDSRGYIELPGVRTVEVVNPGTRAEFKRLLIEAVQP